MIKVYIIKVQKRNVLKTSRLTFEDMKLNNTKKKNQNFIKQGFYRKTNHVLNSSHAQRSENVKTNI